MKKLSEDKIAVLNFNKDAIVEANAGTGKTKLIVEKFITYLEKGISVDEIVLITFTEAAAKELKDRVKNRIYEEINKGKQNFEKALLYLPSAHISTIHSFCYDLLKRFGIRNGYLDIDCEQITDIEIEELLDEAVYSIIGETDLKFLKNLINKISSDYVDGLKTVVNFIKTSIKHRTRYAIFRESFSVDKMFESVIESYRRIVRDFSFSEKAFKNMKKEKEIAENLVYLLKKSFEKYEFLKKENRKIGYNDLLELTYKMVKDEDNIREEIAENFKVIIVDEFQDTDPLQWKIIETLKEKTSSPPEIFVVGDPKQSIYRFRSADISIWKEATEKIKNKFYLTTNYRSGKNLLEIFNKTFDILYNKSDKPLGVELSFEPFEGVIEGGKVETIIYETYNEREFAEKALKLTYEDSLKGQVAVIGRKRRDIEKFEEVLREHGITYSTVGTNPFNTYGMKEFLNLLKWLKDKEDKKSLFLLLSSRFCGLDHYQTLSFIKEGTTGNLSLDEKVKKFLDTVEVIRNKKDRELHSVLLTELLEITGYMDILSVIDSESYFSILELIKEVSRFEKENYLSFDKMVEEIEKLMNSREKAVQKSPEKRNGYFLMTIHAAKGLQFDTVILLPWGRNPPTGKFLYTSVGFGVKLFHIPSQDRETEEEKFESSPFFYMLKKVDQYLDEIESKNLVYVAMTRAKNRLITALLQTKKELKFPYGSDNSPVEIFKNFVVDKFPEIEEKKREDETFEVVAEKEIKTIPVTYPTRKENKEKFTNERGTPAPYGISPKDYGTAVHLLCEAFIKGADRKKAISYATTKFQAVKNILIPRLNEIFDYLENELSFLKNAQTEVDVKHFNSKEFLSGRVDIILKEKDSVEIWDIKTGYINENSIEEYKKQLNFYKRIFEAYGLKVKALKLLFIDEKSILEVNND
ncbi:UvrD-helicase domain-containing protein [Desulfurobacterium atlanticum]|uniref:DNA 3'-5' helicase n=1 Tax=Desulfurobacterium atlanticum TaxID=240169 RepID=A0A239A3F2_9BACT|nr:UvrD-helicase domain-containing protein [Desulfurobacterium atlanticum]SNR90155.1 Superfamily I DNA or RNA helicase [Desulfurobacterium atlanticum]